jgi:hypothetical protein
MAKNARGGRREGSGRHTFFKGKSSKAENPLYGETPPPQQLLLSWKGWNIMEKNRERATKALRKVTGKPNARISRSVFVEGLIRKHGHTLTLADIIEMDSED